MGCYQEHKAANNSRIGDPKKSHSDADRACAGAAQFPIFACRFVHNIHVGDPFRSDVDVY